MALWAMVLMAIWVLRRDVYGTTIARRGIKNTKGKAAKAAAAPSAPPRPPANNLFDRRPVQQPSPDAPSRLVVTSGPMRGTSLPLGATGVVIGRSSSANLVLDDEYASSRHAQVVTRGGQWFLEDLGSTNGTMVGRDTISTPVALKTGSSFRIGQTTLEVQR
ncbi:MAG: FHA domain-containing protein [Micrococcales bacterium]|nr:FHA domain-containing protein [Micrococcales bacterium]